MDELDDRTQALLSVNATLEALGAIGKHISPEMSETVALYFQTVNDAVRLSGVKCAEAIEAATLKPELVAKVLVTLPVPVVQI
ncbi:hypothetical protein [Granulicella paludicola]|uniref:hypothetical protein n=1 Tax=Granulicella paludicola TaxID=474951 RepID=UPI0021DF4EA0|nr:hypothetical protein [Granulicella paludicola]